ncbi:MAG: XRE family transcriptional regulator [Acidobacteria bacterium]|nr:MAG: XRE family transcriptional regulator [Acidobacteriota bacterium]
MNSEALNTYLRGRIRQIRHGRQLTVTAAAQLAGIPVSSFSSLETGGHRFTLGTLQKILAALKVAIAEVWPPFWHESAVVSDQQLIAR